MRDLGLAILVIVALLAFLVNVLEKLDFANTQWSIRGYITYVV